MNISVLATLLLLGAAQGLFLAILLVRKERGHPADLWLAALMTAYSVGLATIALGSAGAFEVWPHLVGSTTAVPFLYGPLHYLYVRRRVRGDRIRGLDAVHFLPFAAYTLYLIPFYLQDVAYKGAFFEQMMSGDSPAIITWMSALKAVHGTTYLYVAWRLLAAASGLRRPDESVRDGFLLWLNRFTLLTLLVWIVHGLLLGFDALGMDGLNAADAVTGITMTIVIYAIGYLGLREEGVFTDERGRTTATKYERSGLDAEEAGALADNLLELLRREKPFMDEDFSLQTLATDLDASPHHVSQVINEYLERTFFDLINEMRIELARDLLRDPQYEHWTMLAIAQEVGFGSRSSFNKAFKKHAGMTPSAFRDSVNADQQHRTL